MIHVQAKRRGIFFLSVLFLSLVLAMFVAASLDSGMWGLKRGQNQNDVAAARRAASSGVEYALARLKANPAWTANTPNTVTVNEPDFFVVEEYGNVIGVIKDNGRVSQFRIRFNYADGTGGADNMPDTGTAMSIASPFVSFNNMIANGQGDVPIADGPAASVPATPTIYTNVPGHSVFLAVEGRCGDWLAGATTASPNPAPPALGAVTTTQVETVFKVANALDGGTPAVASAAGNFEATLATTNKKDNLSLDSSTGTQVGRLRTRGNLNVTGGQSGEFNLTAGKGGGEFRALGTATHNADPTVVQEPEAAADTLYPIPWSDVHQADGSNALPAGTYVFWDDGSLHYFDMNVTQYYDFMSNPLNHSNPGLPLSLPSSVVPSSSGSGAGLKAKLTISADTLVQAATNTTDLAILPQKGASGGPGSGGAGPQPSVISDAITGGNPLFGFGGAINFPSSTQILMPDPRAYNLFNNVAVWSAGQGVGTYSAGNWNLPSGGALNQLGTPSAMGNLDISQVNLVAQQLSSYIAANPTDPNWSSFASALSIPSSTDQEEISAVPSAARPSNIEVKFDPATGQDSATLTGPGNVTIGAKLSGEGASITAEGNLSLVGLGVNLSALSNPTEGVSLYSKKDVSISTFDKNADAYRDVALKGVVYAWGNFRAILGSTSISESDWGKLKLTGAMIAYGKDPSDLVAAVTNGNVKILAKEAKLKYDSSYMLDFSATLPANIVFNRVRWLEK